MIQTKVGGQTQGVDTGCTIKIIRRRQGIVGGVVGVVVNGTEVFGQTVNTTGEVEGFATGCKGINRRHGCGHGCGVCGYGRHDGGQLSRGNFIAAGNLRVDGVAGHRHAVHDVVMTGSTHCANTSVNHVDSQLGTRIKQRLGRTLIGELGDQCVELVRPIRRTGWVAGAIEHIEVNLLNELGGAQKDRVEGGNSGETEDDSTHFLKAVAFDKHFAAPVVESTGLRRTQKRGQVQFGEVFTGFGCSGHGF